MEPFINWIEFFSMLPFMLVGQFIHILGKFVAAKRKPGYSFGQFVQRNALSWLLGICYSILGCYFCVRGIDTIPGVPWDIAAIFFGISGGSLSKSTVKLFISKKGRTND